VRGASESENKMRPGSQAGEKPRASLLAHAAAVASQPAPTASTSTSAQRAAVRSLGVGAISLLLLCGFGAAGCSISQQSLLISEPKAAMAPMSLIVDTVPSGAEARIPDGSSCYTPCELSVTPTGPFVVEFTLKGYEPQSAKVILAAANPENISAGIRLDPNPLTVELPAIPRPGSPARSKPVAKQPATSSTTKPPGSETAGFYWPQIPGQ
jgi:hypothetical protein